MWFIFSLFAALASAVWPIFTKKLSNKFHPLLLLFLVNLSTLVFQFVILFTKAGFPRVTPDFYKFLALTGFLDTIAFTVFLFALKQTPISLLSPVQSFIPLFSVLITFTFVNESLTLNKFMGVLLIVMGSYVLYAEEIKKGILEPFKMLLKNRGIQLTLLSSIIWAITPIFQKKAIFETFPNTPLYASFVNFIFMTIFVLPFIFKKIKNNISNIRINLPIFVLLGIIASLGQFAAYSAFSLVNVGYVLAVSRTSILLSVLFGALFFHETGIKQRFTGALIMIIGVILIAI